MGSHYTIEWLYVALVTGILVWMGADSWVGEKHIDDVPKDAEVIKVTAQQWFWTFEHPDGTKEVGELHLKAGKAYRFDVTSKDVIHAFYVINFEAGIDAVPGRINHTWFAPEKPGDYMIECREYCGLLHNQMRAHLIVEA